MNSIFAGSYSSGILRGIILNQPARNRLVISAGYAKKASGKANKAAEAEGKSDDGPKKEAKIHRPSYGRRRRMQFEKNRERAFDMNQLEEWKGDDHHILGHWLLNSIRDVRKY
ncbi:hypothetical protein AYI70_g11158, partial [Smittium culicis]